MNFSESKQTVIRVFSEFPKTEAKKLKKLASFFQDAIYFHPGNLQSKTLMFTLTAPYNNLKQNWTLIFGRFSLI